MVLKSGNVWNFILVLGAIYKDKVYPCGCANLIAPNLALTATHIFSEHFDRISNEDKNSSTIEAYSVIACQILDGGKKNLQYGVKTVIRYPSFKYNEPIDIALLELEKIGKDDHDISHWRKKKLLLDINPPKVGSEVKAYGYIDSKVNGSDILGDLEWRHKSRVGKGKVLKIHFPFRDKSGMPFPCFETSARFDPGMSGGPVINSNGNLCGIISRGFNIPECDDISWASSLWPAMGMKINGVTLYDLAEIGTILVKGLDRIKLKSPINGGFHPVEYSPE